MKIIKFRVWDTFTKEILYFNLEIIGRLYQQKRYIVHQFTGLYDKNNKKIFEGDIVKLKDGRIGRIRYDDSIAAYKISFNKIDDDSNDSDNSLIFINYNGTNPQAKDVEVIGNIFEK